MKEKELTCECGNNTFLYGFYPCDENGNEIEPTIDSNWNGLYICPNCRKIMKFN